jgi:hypothetical protein
MPRDGALILSDLLQKDGHCASLCETHFTKGQ